MPEIKDGEEWAEEGIKKEGDEEGKGEGGETEEGEDGGAGGGDGWEGIEEGKEGMGKRRMIAM